MRSIAQTLLVLILVGTIACSDSRKPKSAEVSSSPTNAGQWHPATNTPGVLRRNLVGDPQQPGPFKFQLKVPAGARAAVHRHSIGVNVKVLSGAIFIIIGEPIEPSRAQRFAVGTTFVVPAHAWHEEWWDEETVLEAEGVGPMDTVYKN
jgi:hypothetical protein